MPFWVTRTKRVIKYAPTNPMSLVRFQWETRVADMNSKKILYMYRLDDSSIIYNVTAPKVSLFEIPNDPIHYAVPIFKSAPIKKKNLPFSQLDIRRAWASDPSNVGHIVDRPPGARYALGGGIISFFFLSNLAKRVALTLNLDCKELKLNFKLIC